jgi:hypothetical protein
MGGGSQSMGSEQIVFFGLVVQGCCRNVARDDQRTDRR